MVFNQPPNTPPGPPAPAPAPGPSSPVNETLANVSALGTAAGAPVTQISKGPMMPGQAPDPAAQGAGVAPPPAPALRVDGPPAMSNNRQVVGAHSGKPSVGTGPSTSPQKQGNPVHGMTNA